MKQLFYGNEIALQILSHTVNTGRLNHAYLIYGEKGLGKKTFAEYFAKSIFCKGAFKPCDECTSCKKINDRIHPDLKWYLGGEGKNSFHIETIRELRADCAVKPNEENKKIYIITNVQNMTVGAANAFLKTLEEPPQNVLFLLTAPNTDTLAETIVSRLTPIQLFPLTQDQMMQALLQRFPQQERSLLEEAALCSAGNLGQAIQRLSDKNFLQAEEAVKKLCAAFASKQEYRILQIFTGYEKDKPGFIHLLSRLMMILRDVLLFQMGSSVESSELTALLSGTLTRRQVTLLIEFLEEAKIKLSTNANISLLTAYICAEIKKIID